MLGVFLKKMCKGVSAPFFVSNAYAESVLGYRETKRGHTG